MGASSSNSTILGPQAMKVRLGSPRHAQQSSSLFWRHVYGLGSRLSAPNGYAAAGMSATASSNQGLAWRQLFPQRPQRERCWGYFLCSSFANTDGAPLPRRRGACSGQAWMEPKPRYLQTFLKLRLERLLKTTIYITTGAVRLRAGLSMFKQESPAATPR